MSDITIKDAGNSGGLPSGVIYGAAALVGFALLSAGFGRITDIGAVHMPAERSVEALSLRFEDQDNGGVAIRDVQDGNVIYIVQPGTNGFIRATVRGLVRERKRSGVGEEPPFLLTHWSDGTVSLEDKSTNRRVSLEAFGPTNAQAFAQLFAARRATR